MYLHLAVFFFLYLQVCPSDGKILHFGKVEKDGQLEQVKGVTYKLNKFLGPNSALTEEERKGTDLFHVIIYLAPGDYHHFHSPADWTVTKRRHFPGKYVVYGVIIDMQIVFLCVCVCVCSYCMCCVCVGELLTVAPWAAKAMPGLFSLNERAILMGHWKHGFFSMAAVGAFNVGSIQLALEKVSQCPCIVCMYIEHNLSLYPNKKFLRTGLFMLKYPLIPNTNILLLIAYQEIIKRGWTLIL